MSTTERPRDRAEHAGPVLRVVRGQPAPEELAALVAVVTARTAAGSAATHQRRTSAWRDRSRLVRQPVVPRPGAWRASAWPR